MTLPTPGPAAAGWGASSEPPLVSAEPVARTAAAAPATTGHPAHARAVRAGRGRQQRARGLPGGRVVAVATLFVLIVALVEIIEQGVIGAWTGVTLVVVSVVAALITRAGDRSLPAMMPPLAFATAVFVAGQNLVDHAIRDPWQRQLVMVVETLGRNAMWVVTATVLAGVIGLIGHLVTRRSRRRHQERAALA